MKTVMPRGKKKTDQTEPQKQLAFKVSQAIARRVEGAAESLGLDVSNFLRMMLLENLAEYEGRGRKIRGEDSDD